MPEVVEGVEVRPAVDVHLDRVAGVRVLLEQVRRDARQAVDDGAVGRVRHPDVVDRVTGRDPGRHALEEVDGEVEDVPAVEAAEDLRRSPPG